MTFAVDASWTLSAPSGGWSNPANWSSNPLLPNAVDDIATFGAAPIDQFVTVDGNFTVGGLRIDRLTNLQIDSTATGTLTFSSSSGPASVSLQNSNPYTIIFIAAPMVLASDLQLINRASAPIGLSGFMSGSGSLLATGVHATITGPGFYTGTTQIAGGDLNLAGIGQIGASSAINIGNGTLRLTNSLQPSTDRLGDSVPISLSGGMLLLDQGSETAGPITMASSRSDIQFRGGGDLTVASITRAPGSILSATFRSWDNYVDRSQDLGTAAHLFITNPPPLTNGILPWAIVGDALATYGPNGLTQSIPNALSLATASTTSNVGLASDESLIANKTINSLQMTQGVDVNLQGHTLTVNSGAIVSSRIPNVDSEISNGTIVSGASSGELFLYSTSNTLTVSANIANGPSGPTRLVASGGGQIFLGGNNTYTGDTVVNGVFVRVLSANALAPTDLTLNYGDVFFDLTQPATVSIGKLVQHGNGQVGSNTQAPVKLVASSYAMDGGTINLAFGGNGPLTKSTAQPLLFRSSMPNYIGAVDLQDGFSTLSVDSAAGTGPITVRPNAWLLVQRGMQSNAIQLVGGNLQVLDQAQLTGSIHVTSDSRLETPGVVAVPISAAMVVEPNVTLTASGPVRYRGDVQLNGTLGYSLPGNTAAPIQGKVVSGNGTFLGALDIRNGGAIAPGNSVGRFTTNSAIFGPDGIYAWEMGSAAGNPGEAYDALNILGDLSVAATAAAPTTIRPVLAPGAGFDPAAGYFWQIASANSISFAAGSVAVDRSQVSAPGVFSVAPVGKNLLLRYEPTVGHSQWNVDSGGDWPASANWIGPVPDWPTNSVEFGNALISEIPAHILLNGRRFASTLTFNNSHSYVIDPGSVASATLGLGSAEAPGAITVTSGHHSITAGLEIGSHLPINIATDASLSLGAISNGGGRIITKTGQGSLTIAGTQTHGAGAKLAVLQGFVLLNSNSGASSSSGANLEILISGNASSVTLGANQDIINLSIATSDPGKQSLDLASPATPGAFHYLHVYAADIAAAKASLSALIRNAMNNPGDGIYDSGLASHPGSALGLAQLFDRKPYIAIRPTRVGDVNLDGQVTIADFINLASNFNKAGTWQEGDLNADGLVTISDFIDLSSNFGSSYAGDASPISAADQQILASFAAEHGMSVPEPAGLSLLALGVVFLNCARRIKSG